jgi:pSer/pThr/pTyr-binding forkhead associated (FHA) protein
VSAPSSLLLRVTAGAMAGTAFRVAGPSIVVGRSPDCTIAIADPSLSRQHFELASDAGVWRVRDLDSRNGISVNGKIVARAVVRAGDEIRAGDVIVRLEAAPPRLSEAAAETVTSPETEPPTTLPIACSLQLLRR